MTFGNWQAIAILCIATQCIDIGDVELWINTIHEQVHCQVNDVDVASALTVAEERAFDSVGSCKYAEFGCRNGTSAVVVRVQRNADSVAVLDCANKPLDDVAVYVWGVALNCCWQVQDQRSSCCRFDDIHHCFANLDCKLWLGKRKALW